MIRQKKVFRRKAGRSKQWYLLTLLLFSIAGLTVAGGYYYNRNPHLSARLDPAAVIRAFQSESEPKSIPSDRGPATDRPRSEYPVEAKKEPPANDTRTEHSPMPSERRTGKTRVQQISPATMPPPDIPTSFGQRQQPVSSATAEKPPMPIRTRHKSDSMPVNVPSEPYFPAGEVDASQWSLQAIAWSDDPKERIAVIDGHILREGDAFEGMTIAGIGKDTVIIRQGARRVTLEFRLK
jgi:hypothetical protein